MTSQAPICNDDRRRAAVRAADKLTGIDFIEVDTTHPQLLVYFLTKVTDHPPSLTAANIHIEGGGNDQVLQATKFQIVKVSGSERDDYAIVDLDKRGDPLTHYTLRLVRSADDPTPPPGIDPCFAAATFTFSVDGSVEDDCAPPPPSAPTALATLPELSYLARDYASFRQLMLDRLAETLPSWRERHAPDLYLTLIEALAYQGDQLSYFQDAVATEAYLGTARRRISVRRHARLVDYTLHEGCNARAWVCVEVEGVVCQRAAALSFVTRPQGRDLDAATLLPSALRTAPRASYEVFEPLPLESVESVCERAILEPGGLARRLRDDRTPIMREIRARLTIETIALLDVADDSAPSPSALLQALARDLDRLLSDSALALATEAGQKRATARHGTPNALRGAAARRQNRAQLGEAFKEDLAPPGVLYFREAHNTMRFYTWGQDGCHLPIGATSASLRDAWEEKPGRPRALRYLRPGDVLILEEIIAPTTGTPADADPHHRHPVRLTCVEPCIDELYNQPVVKIVWATADALPFALPLSAIGPAPDCRLLEDLSVARGNVVLVDHGETVRESDAVQLRDEAAAVVANPLRAPYDRVPPDETALVCCECGGVDEVVVRAGRYEPILADPALVFRQPLPADSGVFAVPPEGGTPQRLRGEIAPAAGLLDQDPREALPQVELFSLLTRPRRGADVFERTADPLDSRRVRLYERWRPHRDLLSSAPDARHFAVEIDDERRAHLRFGDDECGARPPAGTRFLAAYRVGDQLAGNVGAEAIGHAVLREDGGRGRILRVRNPLPARGGTAPETVAHARLLAPHAFRRVLRRAITREDYAAIVERDFGALVPRDDAAPVPHTFVGRVQRAKADISSPLNGRANVTVYIDPRGIASLDKALREQIRGHLDRYRRIGHDVTVAQAAYIGVELALAVWLHDHYEYGKVRAALRAAFGSGTLPDGRLGFFHPDRLTFGQALAESEIVAIARQVTGVSRVEVTTLRRSDGSAAVGGVLTFTSGEIARLASFTSEFRA